MFAAKLSRPLKLPNERHAVSRCKVYLAVPFIQSYRARSPMPVLQTLVTSAWDTVSWVYHALHEAPRDLRRQAPPQFRNARGMAPHVGAAAPRYRR